MERKLSQLFDFQKFQNNDRLSAIIADVEASYDSGLSDDDLELVSAAGETVPNVPRLRPENLQ